MCRHTAIHPEWLHPRLPHFSPDPCVRGALASQRQPCPLGPPRDAVSVSLSAGSCCSGSLFWKEVSYKEAHQKHSTGLVLLVLALWPLPAPNAALLGSPVAAEQLMRVIWSRFHSLARMPAGCDRDSDCRLLRRDRVRKKRKQVPESGGRALRSRLTWQC